MLTIEIRFAPAAGGEPEPVGATGHAPWAPAVVAEHHDRLRAAGRRGRVVAIDAAGKTVAEMDL